MNTRLARIAYVFTFALLLAFGPVFAEQIQDGGFESGDGSNGGQLVAHSIPPILSQVPMMQTGGTFQYFRVGLYDTDSPLLGHTWGGTNLTSGAVLSSE